MKDMSEEELEKLNYSPLNISEIEFNEGLLPITVKQPLPKKRHVKIVKTEKKIEDKEIIEKEKAEEEEIEEEGEIMELANPEDEESGDEEEVEDKALAELK